MSDDTAETQAVEAPRKKFETIFEHANDAIFIVDVENDSIVDCNPAAEDLVEYSCEELQSMPASDLHPHNLSEFMAFADRVFEEGEGWTDDITCYCKSGDIIPAEMSASVIELDGRPHLVNHIRDTTDSEERDWFEGLIDHSRDLITVVKGDGTVRYQSPSIDHVLGYSPGQLRDTTFFEYIHPDDRADVEEAFEELRQSTDAVTQWLEYRFRRADGTWAWLESIGSYRHDDIVSGYVINSRDVSQRKESQQQAAVLHRMLRHNLRNELNVILGHAETLASADPEETDIGFHAETILDSAFDLYEATSHTRVLGDIIESHRIRPENKDIIDILNNMAREIEEKHPDVTMELDLPDEQFVQAAPNLDVALEHVLRNAVEHNDAESPRVEVAVRAPASDDYVEVVVADNGPGIPEHERAVLLKGEETPLEHGSGLGLWIVNWIVTRSGGQIAFDENDPRGSRVTVAVPPAR